MAALEGTGLQESDILDFSVSVNPLGAPAGVGRAIEAFFFQTADGIRGADVTRVQTCALPIFRAVSIFDQRKDEIIDWLIRESGSTRLKAMVEWGSARAITQEAASMPARAHGYTMASDIPGKENLVYRRPLGVVGVISPWNFPLHLSQRSVAPALALGNAVVIKPASDTPVTGGLLLARIFE